MKRLMSTLIYRNTYYLPGFGKITEDSNVYNVTTYRFYVGYLVLS